MHSDKPPIFDFEQVLLQCKDGATYGVNLIVQLL